MRRWLWGRIVDDDALSYLTSLRLTCLKPIKTKVLPHWCSVSYGESTSHRSKLALLMPPAKLCDANNNQMPSRCWEPPNCQSDTDTKVAITQLSHFKGLSQLCSGGCNAWKWKPRRNSSHSHDPWFSLCPPREGWGSLTKHSPYELPISKISHS